VAAGGYRGVTDVPSGTGMGLGIEKRNPFGSRWRWNIRSANKDVSPREKRRAQKQTLPWKMVGRGGEPKWARERRCRRKAGRLGAGELGLERSSVTVRSKKAEGPPVVWVRSVGGS